MKRDYEAEINRMSTQMERNGEEWEKEKQALKEEYQTLQTDSERQQQVNKCNNNCIHTVSTFIVMYQCINLLF